MRRKQRKRNKKKKKTTPTTKVRRGVKNTVRRMETRQDLRTACCTGKESKVEIGLSLSPGDRPKRAL